MAKFRVFYPARHRWDARAFASMGRAILRADRRAACFSVHGQGGRADRADAEYLRCPRLDGERAASCHYRKLFRGGLASGRKAASCPK